jgi:Flp pilus assembly protein TadD
MRFKGSFLVGAGCVFLVTSVAWCQSNSGTDAILHHAIQLHQAGDFAGAISEYRNYLRQTPDDVSAHSNLGAALAHEGHFEDAIAQYTEALALQPNNPQIRLNLALAYYKSADFPKASVELERVVAADASQRQPLLLLADCYLRIGDNHKVVGLLSPHEQDLADDKALEYILGTALIRDNQVARGQTLIDRIVRDGESAEGHLLMGEARMSQKDFAGAIEEFKRASQLNSRLPDLYGVYGVALAATGDLPDAESAFRKELDSNPNDYTANSQLGALLESDEDFPESRQCFERALRARPGDATTRYRLAALDLREGNTEPARMVLENLVRENPRFISAHISLATAYYKLKRKADGNRQRALVVQLNAEKQAAESGAMPK